MLQLSHGGGLEKVCATPGSVDQSRADIPSKKCSLSLRRWAALPLLFPIPIPIPIPIAPFTVRLPRVPPTPIADGHLWSGINRWRFPRLGASGGGAGMLWLLDDRLVRRLHPYTRTRVPGRARDLEIACCTAWTGQFLLRDWTNTSSNDHFMLFETNYYLLLLNFSSPVFLDAEKKI